MATMPLNPVLHHLMKVVYFVSMHIGGRRPAKQTNKQINVEASHLDRMFSVRNDVRMFL